jgi:hypothetical protein
MVFFSLDESIPIDTEQMYDILERDYNIKLSVRNARTFRAVTHYWITPERVDTAVRAIREVVERVREAV